MSQSDWIMLAVVGLLSIFASWLAAAETSLQIITTSRAERMIDEDQRHAQTVADIAADPSPYVNSVTLVRVISQMCAVVLVSLVVFKHIDVTWQRLAITAGTMTLVSYILWGVGPHTLGRQRAESVARRAARTVNALTMILGPIPKLLITIGNAITPGRGYADGPFSSEAELRELVDMAEASDVIEHGEREMIHSVFELGDTLVREVMVPRTDVVFVEQDKTLRQGLALALRSGFSRIPVIDGSLDDVVGVFYLKDLTRRLYDNPEAEKRETIGDIMREPTFCPDSKPIDELLHKIQRDRNHMVVVVDEFGGTAGLATIEDIVEEIVGEITDEYDAEPIVATEVEPGRFRVSSRMPVDELGDLFGLQLEDEDVETVGGLVAKELNMVPLKGSTIVWNGLEMVADQASGRRHLISTFLVRRAPANGEQGPNGDNTTTEQA